MDSKAEVITDDVHGAGDNTPVIRRNTNIYFEPPATNQIMQFSR